MIALILLIACVIAYSRIVRKFNDRFFEYAPCKEVACELAMAVPLSLVIVASALYMLGAY